MLDVGDVWYGTGLSIRGGILADSGTVTATVTAPDGTVSSPVVTHAAVGTYTTEYPVTQPGEHSIRWVGVAPNAWALDDVFYAAPAPARLLISLDEARKGLGLPASNAVSDEDLRTFVAAATPIIEDITGPILPTSRVETYDGGSTAVALLHPPVLAIASVTETYGTGVVWSLSAQSPYSGAADMYGYMADMDTGLITRLIYGVAAPFLPGQRNVRVAYQSGRAMKPHIVLATRRLVRHLWQSEQNGWRPQAGGPPPATGYSPAGFAVPKAVLEILAADSRRVSGIG